MRNPLGQSSGKRIFGAKNAILSKRFLLRSFRLLRFLRLRGGNVGFHPFADGGEVLDNAARNLRLHHVKRRETHASLLVVELLLETVVGDLREFQMRGCALLIVVTEQQTALENQAADQLVNLLVTAVLDVLGE